MKRQFPQRRLFLAVLVTVLGLIGMSLASAAGNEPSLAGRWNVQYVDDVLGVVEGVAVINVGETRATINLTHPETNKNYRLQSDVIERTDNGVRIVLEGASPATQDTSVQIPGRTIEIPGTADGIELRLNAERKDVRLDRTLLQSDNQVVLVLSFNGAHSLSGYWSYHAAADYGAAGPHNRRNAVMASAIGDDGMRLYVGAESWSRPDTRISLVMPADDPLLHTDELPGYERTRDGEYYVAYAYPDEGRGPRRLLLVFGKELPKTADEITTIESDDPKVSYQTYYPAVPVGDGEFEEVATRAGLVGESVRDALQDGWRRVEEILPEEELAKLREQDVMLVSATDFAGVLPGVKTLDVFGAEGAWLLQYGDFTGDFGTVRDLGVTDGTEFLRFAYRPEVIHFEIRSDRVLPFDSIPLMIGRNGQILIFDDDGNVTGTEGDSAPGRRTVMAEKVADRVYRTEGVTLRDARYRMPGEGFFKLDVELGDVITAMPAKRGLIDLNPAIARVRVVKTPAEPSTYLKNDPKAKGLLWKDAVSQAAACADMEVHDWTNISRDRSNEFWNIIVFTTGEHYREIEVQIGHHAAMLMLRSVFLESMYESRKNFAEATETPAKLEAMRKLLAPYADKGTRVLHGIMEVEVPGPPGFSYAEFRHTYFPTFLETHFGDNEEAAEQWIRQATLSAFFQYRESIGLSIEHAEDIEPCDDVEELLDLVGYGFEAIRFATEPRLVTLRDYEGPPRYQIWRPDPVGRFWMGKISDLAQKVRKQQDAADRDTTHLLTAIAIITIPLGLAGGSSLGLAVLAIDVADFAYTAYDEITAQYNEHVEVEFARGASAVLGPGRLHTARQRDRSLFSSAFAIGMSSMGMIETPGALMTARQARALEAGQNLAAASPLRRLSAEGRSGSITPETADAALDHISSLPARQQSNLALAMRHSRRLAGHSGLQSLQSAERYAHDLAQALETSLQRLNAEDSLLADLLSPEAFARVKNLPLVRKRELLNLSRENPARMSDLLAEDDAFDVFLGRPFDNLTEFTGAVDDMRRRVGDQGLAHFHSATPSIRELDNLHFFDDISDNGRRMRTGAYRGSDQQGAVGVFIRRREGDKFVLVSAHHYRGPALRLPGEFDPQADLKALGRPAPPKSDTRGGHIRTDVEMIPGEGTPFQIYMNLRAMQGLGFGYADPGLKSVRYGEIWSADTNAKLVWLAKTYPEVPVEDLFRYTLSYDYVKSFLEQAGFEIVGVRTNLRFEIAGMPDSPEVRWTRKTADDELVATAEVGAEVKPGGVWYSDKIPAEDFKARFNLNDDDVMPNGYWVELDVRPRQSLSPEARARIEAPPDLPPSRRLDAERRTDAPHTGPETQPSRQADTLVLDQSGGETAIMPRPDLPDPDPTNVFVRSGGAGEGSAGRPRARPGDETELLGGRSGDRADPEAATILDDPGRVGRSDAPTLGRQRPGASGAQSGTATQAATGHGVLPKTRIAVSPNATNTFIPEAGGDPITLDLGDLIGEGGSSAALEYGDRVVRLTKISGDFGDAPVMADNFGRRVLEANEKQSGGLYRVARRHGAPIRVRDANGKLVQLEIVERIDGTARAQIDAQGGRMTEGQSAAIANTTRYLNRRGHVWADNHHENFRFRAVDEDADLWQIEILDTGGIYPMRGSPTKRWASARAMQEALNNPPQDFIDRVTRANQRVANTEAAHAQVRTQRTLEALREARRQAAAIKGTRMRQIFVRFDTAIDFNAVFRNATSDPIIMGNPDWAIKHNGFMTYSSLPPAAFDQAMTAHYGRPPPLEPPPAQ